MSKPGPIISSGVTTATAARAEVAPVGAIPRVTSESLLGQHGQLKIQHNGDQYSLRRTRHGKLILTK